MATTYRAKLSGKGQVQVPKQVREALHAATGDEMVFRVEEEGAVYVTCEPKVDLMDLAGALKPKDGRVDRETERQAVRQYAVQRERDRLNRVSRKAADTKERGPE